MSFPNTHHTLIQRLAYGGSEYDWHEFLNDYWLPLCRFSMHRGRISWHDAEEIAAKTLEVLLQKDLLKRWYNTPRAKLRTLLCSVTCRVQANHARAASRREFVTASIDIESQTDASQDSTWEETFYAAWVDDLLQKCLNDLVHDYHRDGKGDYVRVLYGRLCEELSIADVAEALDLQPSTVDNYYRHAKHKLAAKLRSSVQSHVMRYSRDGLSEFESEWNALADYLSAHGGIEQAVRDAEQLIRSSELARHRQQGIREAIENLKFMS